MLNQPNGIHTLNAYVIKSNVEAYDTTLVLDSCVNLTVGAELFLHQTQYLGGIGAGRYTFVTLKAVTSVAEGCIVQTNVAIGMAFRTGTRRRQAVRLFFGSGIAHLLLPRRRLFYDQRPHGSPGCFSAPLHQRHHRCQRHLDVSCCNKWSAPVS